MRILYIFPHPDDESFGPAGGIWQQKRQGHEVFLLTLTKGGATKQRFKFNYSIEEMGEVRYKEMLEVEKTLNLNGMTVLDFPDSGLKEMDPRELEAAIQQHIEEIRPEVVITYAVHGISGFHDHLVSHAVVKRVYLEMKENGANHLKRLALLTIPEDGADKNPAFKMNPSKDEEIDCTLNLTDEDVAKFEAALNCYKTYQEVIQKTNVVELVGTRVYYEFFQEDFDPKVDDITAAL
ncbi:PIG-L family deacetylase [bacterium]|nr:PIG-L family deacetylase [bacterium]